MAKARKTEGLSIEWSASGSYPVRISKNLFDSENTLLADILREVTGEEKPRVLIVADHNVVQRTEGLGTRLGKYVRAHGIDLAGIPLVMGGGEKIKTDNLQSALKVVTAALEAKVGARDVVLVVGGGSLFDVAGYAAAQVRGGVKVVRVPTTVAGMADAAFAGTAALNGAGIKDSLRVPCPPAAVLIDPLFTKTVLDGVWRGGIGEILRQTAIGDAPLFKKVVKNLDALKARDADVLAEILGDLVSTRVKKGGTDFALWSALRLETMSAYKLPHGYAVPIGMCLDCAYAVKKGILEESEQEHICKLLADCGALDGLSHSQHLLGQPEAVLQGLDAWRLATGSEAVVLPTGLGKSTVEEKPDREVYATVMKELLAAATAS